MANDELAKDAVREFAKELQILLFDLIVSHAKSEDIISDLTCVINNAVDYGTFTWGSKND